jgi:glycyl-tRNA synthetase beta chain
MPVPFLLEIGCEEIPDWMIRPALEDLKQQFTQLIAEHQLGGQVEWVEGTPRRLALGATGLVEKQANSQEQVMGPPVTSGAKAAEGFARKMGVTLDQLVVVPGAKGASYYSFTRVVMGRDTVNILAEALPQIVGKISFPKTMYWTGKGGPRFIRPIRWLVCLLNDMIVPFSFAGVESGNVTQGHRRLGSPSIPVTIDSYRDRLKENFVLVLSAERRARIRALMKRMNVKPKADDKLMDTLVYLTEYPTPIQGSFDPGYLELPAEVLVTVMRHHQKYFSVEDEHGKLAPAFVAVMNTNEDPEGLVRQGNERVLRARFNDARFFYQVDQARPLADRVEDLAKVTFQAKLGSYWDKTNRIADLVEELNGNVYALRAARLCKTDLTTEMVKEFTDLQGVIGGLYARAQGEDERVWRAIYDHYKPLSMEDSIPGTEEGRILAVADKVDTLRGCFGIGLVPTGSKDPFALRRAAQGVVKILVEGKMPLLLSLLSGANDELKEFLLDRVRYYFKEVRGFQYDEVNAVLKSGAEDLPDVEERLTALKSIRPTANFEPLAASFKRIANILKQAEFKPTAPVSQALLEAGPERELHAKFRSIAEKTHGLGYFQALGLIASIRPQVDAFFDGVLVNAPDAAVRANRLTLLSSLLTEFSTIADFSEIVTQ